MPSFIGCCCHKTAEKSQDNIASNKPLDYVVYGMAWHGMANLEDAAPLLVTTNFFSAFLAAAPMMMCMNLSSDAKAS